MSTAARMSPNEIRQRLESAAGLAQRGYLTEAENLCREVIAAIPGHLEAGSLLGAVLAQTGRMDEALPLLSEAVRRTPRSVEARLNFAFALSDADRFAEAVLAFDAVLGLQRDLAPARLGRAAALIQLDRAAEALEDLGAARAQLEGDAEALVVEGQALAALGRSDDALACYERALVVQPDFLPALMQRGIMQFRANRMNESLATYNRALALAPRDPRLLFNRGWTLQALSLHSQAAESFARALEADPDDATTLRRFAVSLQALGHFDEAAKASARAVELAPEEAEGWSIHGGSLYFSGRPDAAIEAYERALDIDPDAPYVLGMLVGARTRTGDWSGLDDALLRLEAGVRDGRLCSGPLQFLSVSDNPALQLNCARTYADDKAPPEAAPLWTGERYSHDRIRVAYLSGDFNDHPVSYLFVGVIENHDPKRFETFGISTGPKDSSPLRQRIEAAFEHFHDLRERTDADVARFMREQEIDVVVDLTGYTQQERPRILAHRAAPVQAAYLGFPGTLGASYVDYLITDAHVVPPEAREFYAERIAALPGCFMISDSARHASAAPTREAVGLPAEGFVFCCFNNPHKILPAIFAAWMRILASVPGSVLWLASVGEKQAANLREQAAAFGVDSGRLVFARRVPEVADHLARYGIADLFLDTFPYNAHTTANDALWMGLPVLTLSGRSYTSRVAGSLLNVLGLPELATTSLDAYEAAARRLAGDRAAMADLKTRLDGARTASPVFDARAVTANIEKALETMVGFHREGQPPQSFDLSSA